MSSSAGSAGALGNMSTRGCAWVCSECARAGPDGAALLWSRAGLEDGTLGGDSVVLGLLELL